MTKREGKSLLELGTSIRDAEDSAFMLHTMLQIMFDWDKIKDLLVKRMQMAKFGISPEDPLCHLAYVVGVAIGQIPTEDSETEPQP